MGFKRPKYMKHGVLLEVLEINVRAKSRLVVLNPVQTLPGSAAVWRHLVVVVLLPKDLEVAGFLGF